MTFAALSWELQALVIFTCVFVGGCLGWALGVLLANLFD